MEFSELQLNNNALEVFDVMHFEEYAPVREQAAPITLEGRGLIIVTQTGAGKTTTLLLPVLDRSSEGGYPEDAINYVIMSPTRGLAQQMDQQMEGFSYFMPVPSIAVYDGNGGILFEQQKKNLMLEADMVIAAPGCLTTYLSLGHVDLPRASYFTLGKVDHMLDTGFYEDIMQIIKHLPKGRQTIMFSATMPSKIQQLANTILGNPVEARLAISKSAEEIIQAVYVCYENQRSSVVQGLFAEEVPERAIISASSKLEAEEVAKVLEMMKLNVGEMHSDLERTQRELTMHEFKSERINILAAMDIVSGGTDIDSICLVINLDVPHNSEDYVHHIGHIARANNDGVVLTFVNGKEQTNLKDIKNFLEEETYRTPMPSELGEVPQYNPYSNDSGGRGGRNFRSGDKGGNSRGYSVSPRPGRK